MLYQEVLLCFLLILQSEDEALQAASTPGPAGCRRAEPSPGQDISPGFDQQHREHPSCSQPTSKPQPHLLCSDVWRREHRDTHPCLHFHQQWLRYVRTCFPLLFYWCYNISIQGERQVKSCVFTAVRMSVKYLKISQFSVQTGFSVVYSFPQLSSQPLTSVNMYTSASGDIGYTWLY